VAGERDPLAPEGLDRALGWLERNLDQLTDAARRQGEAIQRETHAPVPGLEVEPAPGRAPEVASALALAPQAAPPPFGPPPAQPPAAPAAPASTTPLLDSIGRDLTALAARGELNPIIGREAEIASVIEILVRSTKRNPVLLGPAGSGKTAIVEGLAQRIAAGKVPEQLKGSRIIEVPLASLVAGTSYRGQLEERLQTLVKEAGWPGIILFFDEIHLLAGAGKSEGGMGAAQVLKPALARGDIAVIGATTPDEYEATIGQDDALARRLTTLAIHELSRDETRPIVQSVRDQLARSRGVTVSDEAIDVLLDFAQKRITNRRFPDKAIDLLEQAVAEAIVAGRKTVDRNQAVHTTEVWQTRASSTPTLDRLGRDLVALAKAGDLSPIVGRDREIDAVAEVLMRQTKRNPILLGPAGSGKTAIVEGLAQRIAAGKVPAALAEVRIFDVPISALAGAVERDPGKMLDLLAEARHPSVVVFLDEIHQLAFPSAKNLAESLKPALSRGDIACIGATTGAEFQAYIEPEAALARRFSPIQVEPMDDAAVRKVLMGVRDSLAGKRGVKVTDDALDELIDLAVAYMPGRFFPDKGVDLVEQAVVFGLVRKAKTVDRTLARESTAAYLGLDLDPTKALAALASAINRRGLLEPDAAKALLARLGVTLRGLDSRAVRPDAVVLLAGPAAASADALASVCAEALFGRTTARISIDLSAMTEDSAISTLLGSAPGLVGSDRTLPLHELRRSPRQVLVLSGIDRCAPSIRLTIAAGLAGGAFTDAMGRTIPLSSAVVILTAPDVSADLAAALLGPDLMAACDVVAAAVAQTAAGKKGSAWLGEELLAPLARRFERSGIAVRFDPSFVEWLSGRLAGAEGPPDAFLDREVTPALIASLGRAHGGSFVAVIEKGAPVLRRTGGK
jgi:ATP-dependent Clp protease ATP-binding subunit ClpC